MNLLIVTVSDLCVYFLFVFFHLFQNEMTVTSIVTSEGDECHVTGVGYACEGQVIFESGFSELANEAVTKLLETGGSL